MTIYILNIVNEEDSFIMPFSNEEKAINFIKNNFEYDKPRKITNELFEGKNNQYIITTHKVDQEKI